MCAAGPLNDSSGSDSDSDTECFEGTWSEETLSDQESDAEVAFVRYLFDLCDNTSPAVAAVAAMATQLEAVVAEDSTDAEASDASEDRADAGPPPARDEDAGFWSVLEAVLERMTGEDGAILSNDTVFACARFVTSMLAVLFVYILLDAMSIELAAACVVVGTFVALLRLMRCRAAVAYSVVLTLPYICARATRSAEFMAFEAAFLEIIVTVLLHVLRVLLYVLAALALTSFVTAEGIP